MKELNGKEKDWINLILKECESDNWKRMQFNSIFYSIIKRSILLKPNESMGFELFNGESDNNENQEEYKKAILEGYIPLVELVNLFRYLKNNNLISFIPNYNNEWIDHELDNFKLIYQGIDEQEKHDEIRKTEENKHRFTIKDSSVVEFLDKKYSHLVSVSTELIELVNNDFKNIEQRNFEIELYQSKKQHTQAMKSANKQVRIAWMAFGIAFFTLIGTLCFNIWGSVKIKSDITEKQLKQIIIQQKMPDVIKTKITDDTLKVKIIKSQEKKTK